MKVAISFADENYKQQQDFLKHTLIKKGGVDKFIGYSPANIDESFKKEHADIFEESRGYGYWLWKPYIILKTLNELENGDYLFYCDSACYFINKMDYLIECLDKSKQDVMAFESTFLEVQYTKRKAFELMGCNDDSFKYSPQVVASFILLRKSKKSLDIIKEYLSYASDKRILLDEEYNNENPYFIDHRHDQSIWSLIVKKNKIISFRDPSQYGFLNFEYSKHSFKKIGSSYIKIKKFENSNYPLILIQYRKLKLYKPLNRIKHNLTLYTKISLYKLLFSHLYEKQ